MNDAIILTFISGVIGTGLGGLLGVVIGARGKRLISAILSIASGIMLAVVFFDLLPESLLIQNNSMVVLLGMVWGIIVMLGINKLVDLFEKKLVKVHTLLGAKEELSENSKKRLKAAGIFLLFAISLHDIPEGMAIGASGMVESGLALTMTIIILIHNIPEGMAISLPLVAGQTNKFLAIILSMIAGSMTVVGGVIGALIGGVSNTITSFSLAFAGGAMLHVTICDMLPNAIELDKTTKPFYYIILGVLLGFVVNVII